MMDDGKEAVGYQDPHPLTRTHSPHMPTLACTKTHAHTSPHMSLPRQAGSPANQHEHAGAEQVQRAGHHGAHEGEEVGVVAAPDAGAGPGGS